MSRRDEDWERRVQRKYEEREKLLRESLRTGRFEKYQEEDEESEIPPQPRRKQWMVVRPEDRPTDPLFMGIGLGVLALIVFIFVFKFVLPDTSQLRDQPVDRLSTPLFRESVPPPTDLPLLPTSSSFPLPDELPPGQPVPLALPPSTQGGFTPGASNFNLEGRLVQVDRCEGEFCLVTLVDDPSHPQVWVSRYTVGR